MNEEKANKIAIANVNILKANEEVHWALPKGCRWFTLQVRDGTSIRIAVESGHVASSQPPYFTLLTNNSWDERYLDVNISQGLSLYFACNEANKVVEVIMGVYDPSIGGEENASTK